MTNMRKLKAKLVEMDLNVEALAKQLGMSVSTLYRKLNGDGETMFVSEANAIVSALGLTRDEALAIFFSELVAPHANMTQQQTDK